MAVNCVPICSYNVAYIVELPLVMLYCSQTPSPCLATAWLWSGAIEWRVHQYRQHAALWDTDTSLVFLQKTHVLSASPNPPATPEAWYQVFLPFLVKKMRHAAPTEHVAQRPIVKS